MDIPEIVYNKPLKMPVGTTRTGLAKQIWKHNEIRTLFTQSFTFFLF